MRGGARLFPPIRPRTKRAKEHCDSIGKLAAGDEVITSGGLLGPISEVGEPQEERGRTLGGLLPVMPAAKPRCLMGVGRREDLVEAVAAGVDRFDSVMPTRHARREGAQHGAA